MLGQEENTCASRVAHTHTHVVFTHASPLFKAITPSQIGQLSKPEIRLISISAKVISQTNFKKTIEIQNTVYHPVAPSLVL